MLIWADYKDVLLSFRSTQSRRSSDHLRAGKPLPASSFLFSPLTTLIIKKAEDTEIWTAVLELITASSEGRLQGRASLHGFTAYPSPAHQSTSKAPPGALVESGSCPGSNKTLKYDDM